MDCCSSNPSLRSVHVKLLGDQRLRPVEHYDLPVVQQPKRLTRSELNVIKRRLRQAINNGARIVDLGK